MVCAVIYGCLTITPDAFSYPSALTLFNEIILQTMQQRCAAMVTEPLTWINTLY